MKIGKLCFLLFLALAFIIAVSRLNASNDTSIREAFDYFGKKEYVIATWNLGHFSLGKKPYSTIDRGTCLQSMKGFRSVLFDSIKADVICFNEYCKEFGKDEKGQMIVTEGILEGEYANRMIGPLLGYSCNGIFSKVKTKNAKRHEFEINKTVGGKMPRANKYYYVDCDLYLGKTKVKLICAHTINSATALCQSQIAELILKYREFDRIIMCGDWNTTDFSLFANSGYQLANDGTFLTYTGSTKHKPIDNIVVRGVKISDVRVINTTLSDHNPLVCRITLQ